MDISGDQFSVEKLSSTEFLFKIPHPNSQNIAKITMLKSKLLFDRFIGSFGLDLNDFVIQRAISLGEGPEGLSNKCIEIDLKRSVKISQIVIYRLHG